MRFMWEIVRSSAAMAAATILSRILGLLREMAYAYFMGDTAVASAFKFSFQVPNLFRRLLGEGALTAAFVPIFKREGRQRGQEAMWEAGTVTMWALIMASGALVLVVVLGITGVLFVDQLAWKLTAAKAFPSWPFFPLDQDTILVLRLLRITFPYLTLVCLAALCMGMLNARGYFFLPALGATMLNLVMIATVVFVAPHWGRELRQQVFALAYGVLAAGILQFGFQLPVLFRDGWRPRWINPIGHPVVREVAVKMVPGMLGVAAYQINVLIIQAVAFAVDRSIIAAFDYAVRLLEFPQGVIGISIATYLLSSLSGLAAAKDYSGFRRHLRDGTSLLLLINLFMAASLLALAIPVVRLLFERGEFTPDSTVRVSTVVMALAPGLVSFSLVNIYARAFYALGDTKTPMVISVGCLVANLILTLVLIFPLRHLGMGIANTTTSSLNAALLLYGLRRKLRGLGFSRMRPVIIKLMASATISGICMWIVQLAVEERVNSRDLAGKVLVAGLPMVVGFLLYLAVAWLLRVEILTDLMGIIARKVGKDSERGFRT